VTPFPPPLGVRSRMGAAGAGR